MSAHSPDRDPASTGHASPPRTEPGILESFAQAVALHLEAETHADGWDRPATLWCVFAADVAPDVPGAFAPWDLIDPDPTTQGPTTQGPTTQGPTTQGPTARGLGADLGTQDLADAVGPMAHGFMVAFDRELYDHPTTALMGVHFDATVVGLVLVTEAWAYPTRLESAHRANVPLHPPSHYADRRELRSVLVVLRDSTQCVVHRFRGGEPEVAVEPGVDGIAGQVPAAVRRCLGLPSLVFAPGDSWPDPWAVARWWWLWTVLVLAHLPTKAFEALPGHRDGFFEAAAAGPSTVLSQAPLPARAFAPLLTTPPGKPATGWETVRATLAELAANEHDHEWSTVATWADDALLAAQFGTQTPDLRQIALPLAAGVRDPAVVDAAVAALGQYLDPAVPFPAVE